MVIESHDLLGELRFERRTHRRDAEVVTQEGLLVPPPSLHVPLTAAGGGREEGSEAQGIGHAAARGQRLALLLLLFVIPFSERGGHDDGGVVLLYYESGHN